MKKWKRQETGVLRRSRCFDVDFGIYFLVGIAALARYLLNCAVTLFNYVFQNILLSYL
jgi:hypothetical protein